MSIHLKPLNQHVMVLTGASSGIGVVTSEAAAQRGVKLVLALGVTKRQRPWPIESVKAAGRQPDPTFPSPDCCRRALTVWSSQSALAQNGTNGAANIGMESIIHHLNSLIDFRRQV
jgi:NAD(P)-dependent dehydrogenase (short-subunit alcohol dehydrogenase family)